MNGKYRKNEGQNGLQGQHKGDEKPASDEPEKSNKWVVVVLEAAKREGHKILNDVQYEHVRQIVRRLEDYGNREELADLDIRSISTFWELREKGGLLGKINLRVYFGVLPEERELVVAMAYKKEEEDQVPRRIILIVEDRIEDYKEGYRKEQTAVVVRRSHRA